MSNACLMWHQYIKCCVILDICLLDGWNMASSTQDSTRSNTHTHTNKATSSHNKVQTSNNMQFFLYESNSKHTNTMRTVYMISIELNLPVRELPDEHHQPNMRDPVEQE